MMNLQSLNKHATIKNDATANIDWAKQSLIKTSSEDYKLNTA